MAVELASGYISLVPSAKDIGSQISREMSGPIESAARQTGDRVGGIFRKLAVTVGGAFAIRAGVNLFEGFIAQAEQSREVGNQTAAALKSTGGAAQVSAKQIGELATALSFKTGVDDEAIQSNENLLLTFTNVQNRVGKGNDIFNQATATVQDMAAALKEDGASASIQLGKALNDPIQGVSALRRVGVQLTDQQTEQVKALVKTGDTLGAQKIILGELTKEFGGSAAAQATASEKFSVIWGNIQERIGGALLPIVDKVATWLGERLPGAIDKTAAVLGPLFRTLGLGLSALVAAFREGDVTSDGFVGVMERVGNVLRRVYDIAVSVFNALQIGFTNRGPLEGAQGLWQVLEQLGAVMHDVTDWVKDHLTISLIGLGIAIAFLIGPVTGTVALVAALAAGAIYAYNHFSAFQSVVDAVATFFSTVVVPAIGQAAGYIADQIGHLADWWRANWTDIQKATENVVGGIMLVVAAFVAPFVFIWQHAGDQILAIVSIVWAQIQNVISTAVRIIRDIVTFFVALLSGDWGKAWDAIKDIPAAAFDFIKATLGNALAIVGQILEGGFHIVAALFSAAWDGIKSAAETGIRLIVDTFLGMVETIVKGAADAFGWVPGIGGKLKDAARDIEVFRDDVNRALGGIQKEVEVTVHAKLAAGQTGSLTYGVRAGGGPVSAGRPYLVGEQGPEIFAPNVPGTIISNDVSRQLADVSAAGPAVSVHADIHPTINGRPDEATWDEMDRRMGDYADTITRAVITAVTT